MSGFPIDFELAANLSPEQSSAVSFVGVTKGGKEIVFANRQGDKAYAYDARQIPITEFYFLDIVTGSAGRHWTAIKKSIEQIGKHDNFHVLSVASERWCEDGKLTPLMNPAAFEVKGEFLFAF